MLILLPQVCDRDMMLQMTVGRPVAPDETETRSRRECEVATTNEPALDGSGWRQRTSSAACNWTCTDAYFSTPERAKDRESQTRNSPVGETRSNPGSLLVFADTELCEMREASGKGANVLTSTDSVREIGQGNT